MLKFWTILYSLGRVISREGAGYFQKALKNLAEVEAHL
jgi:hypothetical protein